MLEYARVFDLDHNPRGECRYNFETPSLASKEHVARFAASIAGPLHQTLNYPETVPKPLIEAYKIQGSLLKAHLWLLKNAPETKFNWESDFEQWRRFNKHYVGFSPEPFYSVEAILVSWLGEKYNLNKITFLGEILLQKLILSHDDLLNFDISDISPVTLPERLTPFDGNQANKTLQLTPSRHAFLFTTALPFFATRYRTSTRARGS